MTAKVIPFQPYKHVCPMTKWKNKGICQECETHRAKLEKHLKASRFRARARKGIVQ